MIKLSDNYHIEKDGWLTHTRDDGWVTNWNDRNNVQSCGPKCNRCTKITPDEILKKYAFIMRSS